MFKLGEQKSHLWRLSDFLCTYRFWVITNFLISIYGLRFLFLTKIPALLQSGHASNDSIATAQSAIFINSMIGVVIALIISRSKSVYMLCFLSVISVVCLFITQQSQDISILTFCFVLLAMFSTAAILLAAGYIAQAAKTPITFIIIFGLIFACLCLTPYSLNHHSYDYDIVILSIIISLAIATILLLFCHKRIFYTLPKRANQSNNDDKHTAPVWTWADFISNYRFWGLILFLMCATFGLSYLDNFAVLYFIHSFGLDYSIINVFNTSIIVFAGIVAIIIACIGYLCHQYWSLFVLGFLLIIALLLTTSSNIYTFFFAIFLYKCVYYALLLIILASIAKAIKNVSDFVITYGVLFTFTQLVLSFSPVFISVILASNHLNSSSFGQRKNIMSHLYDLMHKMGEFNVICGVSIFFIVIGMIFLAVVKGNLFDAPPEKRQVSNSVPQYSSVFAAFILCCIPLLSLLWYANVHNQIRHYSQSPKLLSPTGAVLCILLVPFSSVFIFSSLYDITNEAADNSEKNGWGLILLSFILPPVAAAIIQHRLNKLNTTS